MDSDLTDCIDPTLVVIHAWVLAFLANACKCSWTVLVNGAFWLALDKWVALEAGWTGALADVAGWPGNRILAAWVRVAGIEWSGIRWGRADALNQSIALVARQTGADRRMVPHITLGVTAANPRARVVALEVPAGLVGWTVAVDNTLRLALNVGIAIIERRTLADTFCIGPLANLPGWQGTTATGVGLTRISDNRFRL